MKLKEFRLRFRAWQNKSINYTVKKKGVHHCANCGHDFEGNLCPICGQSVGDGRITWKWLAYSFINIWTGDSRSLPYSIFQLMLRPGHFIGEYISGHRQVSSPPVNMLFGIAVIYAIIMHLFGIEPEPFTAKDSDLKVFITAINWLNNNPGWGAIAMTIFLTIPTWFLFRYSPRHPRHTIPEGISIQVFMSSLMLICLLFKAIHPAFIFLIPLYYYITYRQLFGYNFWGTSWRLMACFVVWAYAFIMLVVATILLKIPEMDNSFSVGKIIIMYILYFLTLIIPIAAVLFIGLWICKRGERRREQKTQ
ncbi:MAG: DUF3667 domain-containing protein [Bacteroidales bacterium]|nr:DUF3667 domain-containing protein [Bacteroidales bacterium]